MAFFLKFPDAATKLRHASGTIQLRFGTVKEKKDEAPFF
jgi:hypothetical protein